MTSQLASKATCTCSTGSMETGERLYQTLAKNKGKHSVLEFNKNLKYLKHWSAYEVKK